MNTSRTCPQCGKPVAPNGLQGLCPECMMKVGLETQSGEPKPPPNPPSASAELAKLFPQLEILECLGWGGMGAVYKARQPRLDRLVALKILIPEGGDQARDAHFAERFEREARALAKLSHPNIVAVYDFGEAGNLPYLMMEYVDGLNLRQLERTGKLSPAEALRIVPQVCEALQFAHEAGIVHRDIKPENILLDQKGRVKIADFGIAKILAGDHVRPTLTQDQVLGTPHYMAPEQVEHPQQVDRRADIYSLGVVFYEMLTGELPLGKFQPPSRKVQVDVRLDEVVLHALEKEPERRYQQASEVKTDVELIASRSAATNPPPVNPPPAQELAASRHGRRATLWPLVLFLLPPILLTGFVLFGYRWFGVDLDPDVQGLTGLLGLPLSAGFGALLAWAGSLVLKTGSESDPDSGGRWSWLALGAAVVLAISMPLGGGAMVLLQLAIKDGSWNPAWGELLITGLLVGGGLLLGITATFMGRESLRCTQPGSGTLRGRPAGLAAAWFWPSLLACVACLWIGDSTFRRLSGQPDHYSPATVVRIEAKLGREITQRLHSAGWQPESVSVSVSPDLNRAECRFGTVRKNGLYSVPFDASIRLLPKGHGLWLVEGTGELAFLRFSVDTSPELEAAKAASTVTGLLNQSDPESSNASGNLTGIYQTALVTRGPLTISVIASGRLLPVPTNNSQWQIDANLPENIVALIVLGQDAKCEADAFPDRPFKGKVLKIADVPNPAERTAVYNATIQVIEPDLPFRQGMSVFATFIVAQRPDTLKVPCQALLFRMPGRTEGKTNSSFGLTPAELARPDAAERANRTLWVLRASKNEPEPAQVRIGIADGTWTEIVEGLHEGDRVVIGISPASKTSTGSSEHFSPGNTTDLESQSTNERSTAAAEDVANVAAQEKLAGGNSMQHFFLIGPKPGTASLTNGCPLLLVLPGGNGGRDFLTFTKRVYLHAVPANYLVAQLIAPKWNERQFGQMVWPTEKTPYPSMQFPTEAFIHSVITEVEKQHRLDTNRIFTFSWSSGGPAAYAASLSSGTRLTGSFIAMSVFQPRQLPDLKAARNHAYFLLHSPEDRLIPIALAQLARDRLVENGAQATLVNYPGGHGWRGDVYGNISRGILWLEERATRNPRE